MELRHVERGTKLKIHEELQQRAISDEHDGIIKYFETDTLIVVACQWLHDNFDRLSLGAQLGISFVSGLHTYAFIGVAKERLRTKGHVMIEQISDVETINQRQFNRDELRVNVMVYGMPEAATKGRKSFDKPSSACDLMDISFDLSPGGVCIITNTLLTSKHDPYYLIEFNISPKDYFLLPAKLVRKSNYPRTKIGKYDCGFNFIFNNIPEEKARLTRAILNRKIQSW